MDTKSAKSALEELWEYCWFCGKEFEKEKAVCHHAEITKAISDAAQMLHGVDFCDHFCCGMPANLCRSVRLAQTLEREQAALRREVVGECAKVADACEKDGVDEPGVIGVCIRALVDRAPKEPEA